MINIIPEPMRAEPGEGEFRLTADTALICENETIRNIIIDTVKREKEIELQSGGRLGGKNIVFQEVVDASLGDEGYLLKINEDGIRVSAPSEAGLFYGAQTLIQLFAGTKPEIPYMEILDKPRFSHRGMMLDVSRHFFSLDELKRLVDLCSLLKLNVFHMHLVDDQGWRIEIKKYPRLTEHGSRRNGTMVRGVLDNIPVSGFYSQSDIRELVSYASDRFIKIIPEIEIPGHAQALLACYPELGCEGRKMDVAEKYGPSIDILCAGDERVYDFLADVVDEVCSLFDSDLIHIGGDEAPKMKWCSCPKCQERIAIEGLSDEEALQGYMTNRIQKVLEKKGRRAIVWNESLKAGNLDASVVCQQWLDKKRIMITEAVNGGRQAVISDVTHYYLDMPYGMTNLKKTYNFEPVYEGIDPSARGNILGIEAPLWTELVTNVEEMDYQIFPRLVAVSETAWTEPERKDYSDFINRLKIFNRLLDVRKVNYAPISKATMSGHLAFFHAIKRYNRIFRIRDFIELMKIMKQMNNKNKVRVEVKEN